LEGKGENLDFAEIDLGLFGDNFVLGQVIPHCLPA